MQVITTSTVTTRDVSLGTAGKTTVLSLSGCTFSDGLSTKTISGVQTVTLQFTPPATTFGSTLAEVYANGVRVLEYQIVDAGVKQYDPERLRYGIARAHPKDVDLTKGIRLLGLGTVDSQGRIAGLATPTLTQDITNSPRADTRTEYGHYIRGAYLDKITNRVYFLSISTLLPTVYYEDFGSDAVVHMQTFPYDNKQYDDRYLVTFHASGLVRVYDYTLKKVIQSVQLPYKLRDGSTPNISLIPMLTIDTEGVLRVHNHATSAVYATAYGTLSNHKQPYYYENRSADFIRTSIHDGGNISYFSGNQYSFLVLSAEARQNAFEVFVSGTQTITATRVSYSGSDQVQFIEIHRNTENSVHTNWVLAAYDFVANTCVNVTFAGAPAYYSKTQPMGALGGFWSTGHWENPPNWAYSINSSGGIDVLAVRNSVPYKVGTLPDRFLMEYVLYTSPSYRAYGRTLKSGPMSFIVDGSSAGVVLPDSIPMVSESATTDSATLTLPANSPSGLLISVPSSLPCTILVNGVQSKYAGPNDVIKLVFTDRTKITQPTYTLSVGRSVTTLFPDTTPNAFTIPDMVGCAIGVEHTTETITPAGFDNAVVSGTDYALINGIRTALPATILEGSSLAFIFTQNQLEQQNTVFIGTVSYTFHSSKDKPAVLTPISLFHIAYARSGVKYTSGLIRNDTGQEVDITVSNGTVIGNKTKLADQETCELEFTVPAGIARHTVTLTSGKAAVAWKIWKEDAYLDPWSASSGNTGVKTDSVPLSFASLPKPAKMSLYLPSGIDAKVNGIDINPDETYSGLDASSTEIEITTNDEVIISGYPNFAPKRVRVGSVYATWLLFPANGDPTCTVPYYDQTYLPSSIPVRLNSVTYSLSQKSSASVRQETRFSPIGGMPLVSSQTSYVEPMAPVFPQDSNAVIQELLPVFIGRNNQEGTVLDPVYRKQNRADGTAASPVYIEQYLDRPDLGVFEYRHQNCEVVDAADGEYVHQNLSRPDAVAPAYVDAQQLFEECGAPIKVDTTFINAESSQALLPSKEVSVSTAPNPYHTDKLFLLYAVSEGHNTERNVSSFSIEASNYVAHFASSALEAELSYVSDYAVESNASNKGTSYSHIVGSLEINFVEAAVVYHMPMVSTSRPDSMHSINLVSHWQRPDYYCVESIPVLVNLVTYTSSNDVLHKSDSGYVSSSTPSVGTQVTHVIDLTARNNSDAHNVFVKEALYKQEHYSTVQSRTKLISLVHNSVASVAINSYQVAHSVELRALFTHEQNSVDVGLSALRTQDVHSIYMPDFTLFESFYVDESQLDLPHGYFQTDLAALSNGVHAWRKQPYEIAPYELQDNVWVWITPVYGFDLCSDVPMYGYIRGG